MRTEFGEKLHSAMRMNDSLFWIDENGNKIKFVDAAPESLQK